MDKIGVVSVSWRRQGVDEVARFTIPADKRPEVMRKIATSADLQEVVYLATCNRVEVVYVGNKSSSPSVCRPHIYTAITGQTPTTGESERAMTAWVGEGAVEHVFHVAAGLDSAMVGETEIRGQMRDSLQLSRSLNLVGPRLEWVFEEAAKTARRIHGATKVGKGKVSLAEVAILRARERLAETPSALGVVGVSPMTERCAKKLAREGIQIIVFNRSIERATELADCVGGVARPLTALGEGTDEIEVVVAATAAPEPVITLADLERLAARSPSGRPPLIIDMANPPDVAAADAITAGVERIDINDIVDQGRQHSEQRANAAADARAMVDRALADLRDRLVDKALSPMLVAMQQKYQETTRVALERLFRKDLSTLSEDDREAVARWARVLARRLAHVPLVGMRSIVRDKGLDVATTFFADVDKFLGAEFQQRLSEEDSPQLSSGEGDTELDAKPITL